MADIKQDSQNYSFIIRMTLGFTIWGWAGGIVYWMYSTHQVFSQLPAYAKSIPAAQVWTLASAALAPVNLDNVMFHGFAGAAAGLAFVMIGLFVRGQLNTRGPLPGGRAQGGDGLGGPRF